jgi:hypothetical protein
VTLRPWFQPTLGLVLCVFCAAQQTPEQKTQVKINYLNVCTPGEEDQSALAAALDRIAARPKFAQDFEISRGRSTGTDLPIKIAGGENSAGSPSRWVRVRREFAADSPFLSTQYSFSLDDKGITEMLVFRSREAKDVMETEVEDTVSAAADPLQVLSANTPADRIRLERFGKSSVVLARCPGADQSKYEPLFAKASAVLANYRAQLGVKETVPADLRRLGVGARSAANKQAPKKKSR